MDEQIGIPLETLEQPTRRTRRERLEARAERRREWAAARDRDGDAARDKVHAIADRIPFGQPILVGHHSEKGARADQRRMENGRRRAVENWNMADRHEQKAAGIESQLRTNVFSDDIDAVEQLTEKIGRLEARRDRMKRFNAAVRKVDGQAAALELAGELLTEREQDDLRGLYRINFAGGRNGLAFPSYALTNLGANIRRLQGRLVEIEKTRQMQAVGDRGRGRPMVSRYGGTCPECSTSFARGDAIVWFRVTREALCAGCGA
jgi:DNA repair exonuclease SbcCD ATPase subunit